MKFDCKVFLFLFIVLLVFGDFLIDVFLSNIGILFSFKFEGDDFEDFWSEIVSFVLFDFFSKRGRGRGWGRGWGCGFLISRGWGVFSIWGVWMCGCGRGIGGVFVVLVVVLVVVVVVFVVVYVVYGFFF